jgi:hypothetical protein
MRFITVVAYFTLTCFYSHGQNLVGYNGKEIQEYMKDKRKDMIFEKVTNNRFKYLKYSNNSGNQTLLCFIDNDSVCKSIRLICDLSFKAEKVKEFDSIYRRSGQNIWIDNRDGKDYIIKLKDEKWSCVITIDTDN